MGARAAIARLWVGPLASSIDLMWPACERAAATSRVAQLVSGTYVPRAGLVEGLRYGPGHGTPAELLAGVDA